jgi:tetratricopeptide (TPR) repeat protein
MLLLAELEKSAANLPKAVAIYREVLAVNPANLIALNNISGELATGSPDEALSFAQRAVELAPDNPAVQDTLGWIYFQKGQYRAATGHLKEAVARDPNPRRQFHLALSYLKTGERGLGQQLLEAAIRRDPSLRVKGLEW